MDGERLERTSNSMDKNGIDNERKYMVAVFQDWQMDTAMKGLSIEVNKLIADGWNPLGAPFFISSPRLDQFCQAMVRVDGLPEAKDGLDNASAETREGAIFKRVSEAVKEEILGIQPAD